jgi:GT2 family glycosyltransferase
MARVSVVVVSYNTVEKLRRCLRAVERHHECIVVDNASSDGSPEMVRAEFPHVKLVASPTNLGFGRANNRGCEETSGDYVLFLNSDCYPDPGAIDALAQAMHETPELVAIGGRLLNPDRSLQESVAGELTLGAVLLEQTLLDRLLQPRGRGYWRTRAALAEFRGQPVPVDQVMGACLMVRAEDGRPVEPFDERYFLYCEDTDLCYRLRKHGRIGYCPPAEFVHDLGSSSKRDPALGIIRYNRGKELYFRIHRGPVAAGVCLLLNRAGALLRWVAWGTLASVRPPARSQAGIFWRVLTARGPDPAESPRKPE